MKKKLICLLLALVMVVACFAGCSSESDSQAVDDINEEASASAMTLVMYLMSEEEVDEDQVNAVQDAVNRITKSKFKTQLILKYYTPDEYYDALEASFADRKAAEAAGLINSSVASEETTEEETFENEWGVSEIKYPEVSDYQVDIFYLGGYAKYKEYMDMGMLQRLDEEISSASKKLNSYISTPFLTYMKSVNNGTYALPTNTAIGEYTYLLINKDALADFDYDTDAGLKDFTSLTSESVQTFLEDVQNYSLTGDEKTDKYTHALYSNLSQDILASTGVYYWGVDENGDLTNDFSVLASDIPAGATYGKNGSYMDGITNVLNTGFASQLRTVKMYDHLYDYDSDAAATAFINGDVAMACIQGGAEIPAMYADQYEAVVVGKPTLNTMDLYENMFAVTSYTTNTSRSMEVLTYLNTNEDMRNLIQYGILGEDYELVDSDYEDENGDPYKVVKLLENDDDEYDYVMDINKTGNTLIAYCTEGENPALIDYIKKQNNDSTVSITMGFKLDYNDMSVDMEALEALRTLSSEILAQLLACEYGEDGATYDAKLTELKSEINKAACMDTLKSKEEPKSDDETCGLSYMYEQWGINTKIYTPPTEEE